MGYINVRFDLIKVQLFINKGRSIYFRKIVLIMKSSSICHKNNGNYTIFIKNRIYNYYFFKSFNTIVLHNW